MGTPLTIVASFNDVSFTTCGQIEALLWVGAGGSLSVGQQMVAGAGGRIDDVLRSLLHRACEVQAEQSALVVVVESAPALATAGGSAATITIVPIKYHDSIDIARYVLRSEGEVLGLFKGITPTFSREVPGNATMFGAYEATSSR
ncbi:hypothetical protein O6H91_01G007100 [Diphasiastrum complanatum]|uniref:Uncharacterized protein n=1 Tax=Diphasiastrum complanatum TaxID=34168 RepID=A0ACC2EN32_DIPCM|nr:hypothetical protein O6H91_01G007100 [Diphasiastrum complanatum]